MDEEYSKWVEYSLWYTGPVETDPGKVALGGGEEADQHPEQGPR